jgi:hypothetical protein
MVNTIVYRIRRPDGSFVDEPVDLPPSVATAVSSLMRMHGGATAAPVEVAFTTYVAGKPSRAPKAVVPNSNASWKTRIGLNIAATTTGLGVAVLCGLLLARVVRSAVDQVY